MFNSIKRKEVERQVQALKDQLTAIELEIVALKGKAVSSDVLCMKMGTQVGIECGIRALESLLK